MNQELPKDLLAAQEQLFSSVNRAILESEKALLSVNLVFEGLRLNPIIVKLTNKLLAKKHNISILVSDEGNAALLKRDNPSLINRIITYSNLLDDNIKKDSDLILIALSPQAYDYEKFERISLTSNLKIVMLNGSLADSAIGIGSIGRDRQRRFINSWFPVYWLEPLKNGALMKAYPHDWSLFRSTNDGYIFAEEFKVKPSQEDISTLTI